MSCECDICLPLVPVDGSAVVVLERSATTIVRARPRVTPERRAALEEALLEAYTHGDAARVSQLRAGLS